MPWTQIGYTESIDSATLTPVDELADGQHMTASGDGYIVPEEVNRLILAYALGPNVTRARVVAPSLRLPVIPEIVPIDVAALPSSPIRMNDWRLSPIPLEPNEVVTAEAAEDAAGASRATILLWLSSGPVEPLRGDIRTLRVTNTTTLVANAWTNGALTLDQELPAGRYACVGARFRSTNLQAFRLVFREQQWRPGGIGFAAVSGLDLELFRRGNMGLWGEFPHNLVPTVDFLANGADSSQTGELDLIKVA